MNDSERIGELLCQLHECRRHLHLHQRALREYEKAIEHKDAELERVRRREGELEKEVQMLRKKSYVAPVKQAGTNTP